MKILSSTPMKDEQAAENIGIGEGFFGALLSN